MPILRVWAHWTDLPPTGQNLQAPPPASLTTSPMSGPAYPGVVPTVPIPPPNWPPSPAGSQSPHGTYRVWAELACETDIAAANWGGGSWAGPPPPPWPSATGSPGQGDEGYSSAATDFTVQQVGILLDATPGTDFSFRIATPGGVSVATIAPTGPGVTWAPVNVASGRGIWTIEIDRRPTSSVSEPALFGTPAFPPFNPVHEPFVSPYGNPFEGVLGILFDGHETTQQPCPQAVVLGAEQETTAGNYQPMQPGACVSPGQNVRLTATVSPPGLSNLDYHFLYGDMSPQVSGQQNQRTHPYQTVTPNVTPTVFVTQGACPPVSGQFNFVVDCCAAPNQPQQYWDPVDQTCKQCPITGLTAAATDPTGCAPGNHGATQLTATPSVGIDVLDWAIDGPGHLPANQQIHVFRSTPGAGSSPVQIDTASKWSGSSVGPAGNVLFPTGGIYTLSVSGTLAGDASHCSPLLAGDSFTVTPCCPPDTTYNPATGKCDPPTTTPTCPPGTTLNTTTGTCDPPTTTPTCPPGTVLNQNTGSCVPVSNSTPPPTLCCILLGIWMALFFITATLLYFSSWWPALFAGILWAIAFGVWIGVCCWPCAKRFWRCCSLLQWLFIAAAVTSGTLFALWALFKGGNGWVIAIYGGIFFVAGVLMAFAKCRPVNPFDPGSWPGCRCR